GYWFEPTIFTGAQAGHRIVDEEQFGPALPIIPYDSIDDALAQANATMYGLCGSVWGADLDRAPQGSQRLECGVACVNSHGVHRPSAPIAGVKWSGIGAEHGLEGLLEFTDRQILFETPSPVATALA